MSDNAFIGRKEEPSEAELTAALGPAKAVWDRLLADLAAEQGVEIREWKCYSLKGGWALRVKLRKRTIVRLSPRAGCFEVLFIFGAKAMAALRQCRLPKRVTRALSEAPKYPEGTGLRLEVKRPQEIGVLKKLAAIKIAN
jgi:hypothetical protein